MSLFKEKKLKKILSFFAISILAIFFISTPITTLITQNHKLASNNSHNTINSQANNDPKAGDNSNFDDVKLPSYLQKNDLFNFKVGLNPTIELERLTSSDLYIDVVNNNYQIKNNDQQTVLLVNKNEIKPYNNQNIDFNTQSIYFNLNAVDKDASVVFSHKKVNFNNVFNGKNKNILVSKSYYSDDIEVFNLKNRTTISINTDKLNVSDRYLPSEFIKNTNNFKSKIDINFINAIPQTIKETKINFIPNDKAGYLIIKIKPGFGVDSQGQLIDLNEQEYVIRGFRKIDANEQDVYTTSWTKTKFNAPFDARDFLNQYPEFENQFMYPSVWDMSWGSSIFQSAVKKYLMSKAESLPSNFNEDNIIIQDIDNNDREGKLRLKFLLSKYIDPNGSSVDGLPSSDSSGNQPRPFLITISGFKTSSAKTSLVSEYTLPVDHQLYNQVYSDTFNTQIEDLIITLIENSPINYANVSNRKKINFSFTPFPESGYVDVSVNFEYIFLDNGVFSSSDFFSSNIKIKGFKSSILTEINTSNLQLGNSSEIAQIADNDLYIINEIILKNDLIINPSPTFNVGNIVIQNRLFNNKNGTVNFDVSLTKFTNNEGVEVEQGFVPINMVINGFKTVFNETRFETKVYNIANSFQNVNDFINNPQKIIDLINPYLLDQVQEYTTSYDKTILSIKDGSVVANSEEGRISFIPIIKNYFEGEKLEFKNTAKELDRIEIIGFRKIGETKVNENANFVLGNPNVLPNVFFENEKDTLKKYVLDRLIYKPDGMTIDNIIIADNSTFSNIEGTITLYVSFNLWYDANGALQNTPSTTIYKVLVTGFRRVKPTSINNKLSISSYNSLASEVKNDINYLKYLVLDNLINNPVSSTNNDNIQLSEIKSDNIAGTITFKVALNKYFNDQGIIHDSGDFKQWNDVVEIKGFRTVIPTRLPTNNEWKTDLIDSIAETASKNESYLKKIVSQKIAGSLPPGFSVDQNIIIENISFSNIDGTIKFSVNLTSYFDDLGNIQNSLPELYQVVLSGFRTVSPTTIQDIVDVIGYATLLPSQVDKNQLIDIVYNNYSNFYNNLPINFFNKQSILIDDNIVPFNNLGYVEILLSTSTYYDINGNLVINDTTKPFEYKRVLIQGFNSIGETIINSGVVIPNVSNIFASDLSTDDIVDYIYNNRDIVFLPIPSSFTKQSISILNEKEIVRNNINGTITFNISIVNYYNAVGIVETFIPKTFDRFVISGFKTTTPTKIDSQVNLEADVKNILASNIKNDAMLTVLRNNVDLFVRGKPDNFLINTVNILNNSISNVIGSLIVEVTYTNYYNEFGIVTNIPVKVNLRCYGFKTASPTQVSSEFVVENKNDILPSSQTEDDIKKIIFDNKDQIFENLPDGFVADDFIVELNSNSYINSQGQVVAKIKLNKYYDNYSNLVLVTNQNANLKPLVSDIILSGFLNIAPTTIKDKVIVTDDALIKKFATSVTANELKKYVFDNLSSIISSVPPNFNENNITISDLNYINNKGTILAKISLDLYYDNLSNLATTNFEPKTIIFEGFNKNNDVTYILPMLFINSPIIQNQPAYSVTYSRFLDYVYDNSLIQNPVPGFSRNDILPGDSSRFVEVNNLEGYVSAKVSIKNYYDYQGNVVNDPTKPLSAIVTMYGFKKVFPTEVISFYNSDSFSHKLATNETNDNLLKIVKNSSATFIKQPAPLFNPQTDIVKIEINQNTLSNLNGTVNATLYINNYFDYFGNLVNVNDPLNPDEFALLQPWNITFSGYRKISPTGISKYFIIEQNNDKLPSTVLIDEVRQMIFDNKTSFFNDQSPDSSIGLDDFDVRIINRSNLKGEINIELSLYRYTDENGNLVTRQNGGLTSPLKGNVLVKGYKSIGPTSTISSISPINLNDDLSAKLPYKTNASDVVGFIIRHQRIILLNSPIVLDATNFTIDNIISLSPFNLDGVLKVEFWLNDYYNNDGELVNAKKTFKLDITDLKKVNETSATNYFLVNSSMPIDKTPQELYQDDSYLARVIFENKQKIFTFLPNDVDIADIIISDNRTFSNLNGTITMNFELKKYYDKDGNFVSALNNTNNKNFSITLGGFQTTKATIFSSQITLPGYEQTSPSDFLKQNPDAKEIIYQNRALIFSNLSNVPSFTKDSIFIIGKPLEFDSAGKIVINFQINNYYNNEGTLTPDISDAKSLTINGFHSNPITTIFDNPQVNKITIKPSQFFEQSGASESEQLKKFIFDNKSIFFENLPSGNDQITIDDIIVKDIFANDKNGYIKLSISLGKYYDSYGVLQKKPSTPKDIIISGFASQPATSIGDFNTSFSKNGGVIKASIGNDYLTVDEFFENLTIDEQNDRIKTLIISSIVNSNDPTNKGYLGFKSFDIDNKNGVITINELKLTNFFDAESGRLVTTPVSFTLVIGGFRTTATFKLDVSDILIYVSIAITSLIILSILAFFAYKLIRYKYLKI